MDPEDPDPPAPPGLEPPPETLEGAIAPATPSGAFTLQRETVTVGRIISRATEVWQQDVGTWVLAIVLAILVGIGVPFVLGFIVGLVNVLALGDEGSAAGAALVVGLQIGIQIIQTIVQGILAMGFVALGVVALHGRRPPIGALFSQIPKWLKYILQILAIWFPIMLAVGTILVVFALVFAGVDLDLPPEEAFRTAGPALGIFALVIIPIVAYVGLGLLFAQYELAYNDDAGPIEAVIYSWRIASGRRWLLLGVSFIAGLIAAVSMMLCGIGFLFGGPLASLILTTAYLALRNGADVPDADTASTLGQHA